MEDLSFVSEMSAMEIGIFYSVRLRRLLLSLSHVTQALYSKEERLLYQEVKAICPNAPGYLVARMIQKQNQGILPPNSIPHQPL